MYKSYIGIYLVLTRFSLKVNGICKNDARPFMPVNAPIVCTSNNSFMILDGPDVLPSEFPCVDGRVCADNAQVCVDPAVSPPDCASFVSNCGNCDGAFYTCVNENEYVLCSNGQQTTSRQRCSTTTPHCHVSDLTSSSPPCVDDADRVIKDCTAFEDGSAANPTTPTPTTNPAACNGQIGTHADLTDPTCQSYFFCYLDGTTIRRTNYNCGGRYVFNPTTKKCVQQSAYACTGAIGVTMPTVNPTVNPTVACGGQSGNQPDLTDPTCQRYFFCYFQGDVMQRASYQCSGTYVFDRNTRRCVRPTAFACPPPRAT